MKKIIIALCGIFVIGTAMSAPSHYAEPKENPNLLKKWKGDSVKYNNALYNFPLYDDYLEKQMCPDATRDSECKVSKGDGTYDDEKAVVIYMAKNIYEHGGEFCAIQVQPGNENNQEWVWLDYYHKDSEHGPCYTYCETGFDPKNGCKELQNTDDEECDFNYTFPFKNQLITSGGHDKDTTGLMTTDINVFKYENEKGAGNKPAGAQTTKHTVLGISNIKDAGSGVLVAPIEITGWREKVNGFTLDFGAESWIKNINVATKNETNQTSLLCAHGYKPVSGKCVLTKRCKKLQTKIQNEGLDQCDGYIYYKSTEHEEKYKEKCKYYLCKESGYGFRDTDDHTCISCPTTKTGGVSSDGYCVKCATREIFDNSEKACKSAKPLSKTAMTQCWKETDKSEYAKCVNPPNYE